MFRARILIGMMMLSSSAMAIANADFLIGLSAGPTWISGNQTQTISLQSDVVKTYTADRNNHLLPSFELFVGRQKPLAKPLLSHTFMEQFGLSIVEASNADLTGDIWEDADPNFNNSYYTYKIKHMHVAAKGRLILDEGHAVEPYVSGSVGVGFNRAYQFTITPRIPTEVASPAFGANTTTTFSYTLGIGLQKRFYENLQVAIGYEFADWGKSSLSPAANQTTSQNPTLNHLYAHTLQLSLLYV